MLKFNILSLNNFNNKSIMENITIQNVPQSFIENIKVENNKVVYWDDGEIKDIGKTSSIFSNSL